MPDEGQRPIWSERIERYDAPGIDWIDCEKWRAYLLDKRMQRWGFPRVMLRSRLSAFRTETESESDAVEMLNDYVEDFHRYASEGSGVAIYGDVGVGKTTLVCAVCRELLENGTIESARYWDVANLLAKLRPNGCAEEERAEILQDAMKSSILVLDDLGAHNTTDWVREQIGLVVNHRWSNGLPTFVTTNARTEEAEQSLGSRTLSRLLHNTMAIGIEGADKRAAW